MPDVVGMVFSQARDALKARGFSVKRVDKYSMTKTAEHILKQSWRVGAIVPADSTVRLTVAIPFPPPVNGNPWDYNWACCKKIFDPPSEFCSFFSCVTTFHNGEGYVVQCRDGLFSATGGSKRVCSTHDGHDRTLLQP
jgi:hypothetical protein